MKPYIPKQPRQTRERIEAKLDTKLARKFERYCEYLESDRDYVLSQALELIFRKARASPNGLDPKNGLPQKPLPKSLALGASLENHDAHH